MKYQNFLFSLLFLGLSTQLTAQTAQEVFEKDITTFMNNTAVGNFDAVLDMTYPKLFTLVPREQMKGVLASMMDNPEMKIGVAVDGITKVYDPLQEGEETFQRIDYNSITSMMLSDAMWEQKDMMINGMKASMGTDNIIPDEASKTITVKQVSAMIAIKNNGDTDWKYLQFQANQAMMLKAIIPESVINAMFDSE